MSSRAPVPHCSQYSPPDLPRLAHYVVATLLLSLRACRSAVRRLQRRCLSSLRRVPMRTPRLRAVFRALRRSCPCPSPCALLAVRPSSRAVARSAITIMRGLNRTRTPSLSHACARTGSARNVFVEPAWRTRLHLHCWHIALERGLVDGRAQYSSCIAATECDKLSACKSYACSPSALRCNLNAVALPTSTAKAGDFQWCAKSATSVWRECEGREYLFDSAEQRPWHDAEEHCVLVGGHLATPETDAQIACISSLVGGASAWIGLWSGSDTSCSRVIYSPTTKLPDPLVGWVWVDGVARVYNKWWQDPGGDPRVLEPDCVVTQDGGDAYSSSDGQGAYLIGSRLLWADGPLNDRRPYVCSRGAFMLPRAALCAERTAAARVAC